MLEIRHLKTLGDAMVGHELQGVLMSSDTEMGHAFRRVHKLPSPRKEDVCAGLVKLHILPKIHTARIRAPRLPLASAKGKFSICDGFWLYFSDTPL